MLRYNETCHCVLLGKIDHIWLFYHCLHMKVCRMGKYHNVLYIALKVSWEWGVKDSDTICSLLNEIYSCEKTFERLFLGSIFGSHAPYFIAGWRSDFRDQVSWPLNISWSDRKIFFGKVARGSWKDVKLRLFLSWVPLLIY